MASCFALCAITSLQGGALALVGPRAFRRVSPILQVGVTAAILLLLCDVAIDERPCGRRRERIESGTRVGSSFLPPVWFLGVYEWLLGTDDDLLRELAARAGLALAGVAIATVSLVPLAGRRLFEDAVAGSAGHRPRSRRPTPLDRLARIISRVPQRKAGAQMLLATCGRVNSHRFAFALATGVFAAFAVPAVFSGLMRQPVAVVPPVSVLAIPLVGISVSLIALRVAAGLSTDPRSGWMCAATVGQTPHGTVALRRTMWLLGILPMSVVFPAITWLLWDATTAVGAGGCCGRAGLRRDRSAHAGVFRHSLHAALAAIEREHTSVLAGLSGPRPFHHAGPSAIDAASRWFAVLRGRRCSRVRRRRVSPEIQATTGS